MAIQHKAFLFLALWIIQSANADPWRIYCNNSPGLKEPDPDDCTSYFMCLDDSNYVHITCPTGEIFERTRQKCLPGGCSVFPIDTTTESETDFTTDIPTDSSTQDSTESSTQTSSESSAQTSSESSTQDSTESSTQTSTEPSIPTSSEIPSEGTTIPTPFQCVSEGKYPNPSNCHKYYQCFSNGKSIEVDCGPTQYYDGILQDCRPGSC